MADTTSNQETSNQDINSTITTLRSNLNSVPPEQAIALIERWQHQLQGTGLAEDLTELKQAILNNSTTEIAKLLTDLGENTTAATKDVPADLVPQIQEIGSLLAQAGKMLSNR